MASVRKKAKSKDDKNLISELDQQIRSMFRNTVQVEIQSFWIRLLLTSTSIIKIKQESQVNL